MTTKLKVVLGNSIVMMTKLKVGTIDFFFLNQYLKICIKSLSYNTLRFCLELMWALDFSGSTTSFLFFFF